MVLTHLLDTSAWLAHIFDEPGADTITALLEDMDNEVAISVLSIVAVSYTHLDVYKRQAMTHLG